ncbi:MAG: aldo/keto reductase [Lachnospiraceae bacterium]|nr:aldo/keto reductase [Lachnospiraceae bacterium]
MEKRKMINLGIETSLLGFGCMRFPQNADGSIDEKEAERMLDKAISEGVNYIDTAYPYHDGKSEIAVGKILKKYDRSSFYLATKLPVWLVKTIEDVDKYFEEQLAKLQTDYIDFYLLHAMDRGRWDAMLKLGAVERLEELKAAGKIKYLGFSFHDSYEVFEEMINYRDWDFCQIQLNYMDANEQAGIKGHDLAEKKGVPLVIMEPVKGGSLAAFSDEIMDKFHAIDPEASAASFALRWVGSQPGVKVILSGMSNMEQVEDNLKTFKEFKPLSEAEKQTVDEVKSILDSRVQNGCTGCRYCMPCPAGVDIPGCFSAWNTYHVYQNYYAVNWKWETEMGEAHQAKNCVECGKCEKACPQKLSVREDLKKVQADLDAKEMIM